MEIRLHPHCLDRLEERGTTEFEVKSTIETGERFEAKFGRTGFRKNFSYSKEWHGKFCRTKQLEVVAAKENNTWLALTVITKYF